jgi:hypothetical protein
MTEDVVTDMERVSEQGLVVHILTTSALLVWADQSGPPSQMAPSTPPDITTTPNPKKQSMKPHCRKEEAQIRREM